MAGGHDASWSAADLHALADLLADLSTDLPRTTDPVDLLAGVEALERVKRAAAAAEVRLAAGFADRATGTAGPAVAPSRRPTPPRAMSVGAEVAAATSASPWAGGQRVVLSRRLRDDLPGTLAALARGELTEERAFVVAREVAHLDPDQRRQVDDDLGPRLPGLGDARLRQAVRRACLTVADGAEARRHRRARADRRVTSRRLDDGTGQLVATLRLEDLAAVRAALDAAAATARAAGDDRTGGQVRADTLVARLTGLDPATDATPVRVELVIGVESLFGDGTEPGLVLGEGFLPAALCTDLVRRASAAAKARLRRLFTSPVDRALVAMESTSRRFDGALAELLDLRDQGICRTPWCDAAVRHHDHVVPASRGGATSAANGQGLCERCNYLKESPGWSSWTSHPPGSELHQVRTATEHLGFTRSTAPPLPGGPAGAIDYSACELRLASNYTLAGQRVHGGAAGTRCQRAACPPIIANAITHTLSTATNVNQRPTSVQPSTAS